MNARFSDHNTHGSVPGAWWWNHREMPVLRRSGTHYVALGFPSLDDAEFKQHWMARFDAVVDDFGNLVRVV